MSPYFMSATLDFGKTMSDCGRWKVLRASLTRLFILCLVTESLAVFLDTTTAYPLASFGTVIEKFGDEIRLPFLTADWNSARGNRFRRGSTANYAVRRLRPILRRFCTILRPAAVELRERNPCVFARLHFFGWYVLFAI